MSLDPVRLLLLLAAILTPKTIAVETGTIEGHVRDAATATPVANARVLIAGTKFAAVTNAGGYYRIDNIPVGTYTVRGMFIGYAQIQPGSMWPRTRPSRSTCVSSRHRSSSNPS
ncbi:MAG TPA: carboxypeptidase-like regulatory domain-containing protein [Gemmatimonadales bacterium]|jgi:hypothetical protein|nr:carboxypeptidase-like regulatory domain-containing protein [Gemmatimonadales bacterium]